MNHIDRLARAGYERAMELTREHFPHGQVVFTWETDSEKVRQDWREITRAIVSETEKIMREIKQ